jgi:hypothetical protein
MGHNMVLSYDYAKQKGVGDKQMHLRRCFILMAMQRSHWTHRLGGRQGNSKQNNNVICTHFDGRFDGRCNAAVLYEVRGFHKIH